MEAMEAYEQTGSEKGKHPDDPVSVTGPAEPAEPAEIEGADDVDDADQLTAANQSGHQDLNERAEYYEDPSDVEEEEDVEDVEEEDEDIEETETGTQDLEDVCHGSGGSFGDAGLGPMSHLSMGHKWRPPNLRILSLQIAFRSISVTLPDGHELHALSNEVGTHGRRVLLEMVDLNLTMEGLMQLPKAERLCLQRLGIGDSSDSSKQDVDQEASSFSGSCGLTLCSLELVLLEKERTPLVRVRPLQAASWVLTARLRADSAPNGPSTNHQCRARGRAEVCIHGLELLPQPVALESLGTLLLTFHQAQEAVAAVPPCESHKHPAGTDTQAHTLAPTALVAPPDIHVDVVLRNTMIDLTLLAPPPLRPLRLIIPSVRACLGESLPILPLAAVHALHALPQLPQWHAMPSSGDGPDPDWHVYSCLCTRSGRSDEAPESKSLEGNWELLVTERQWLEGEECVEEPSEQRLQRLLLPRDEFLRLSASKLKAFEQMQLQDGIAEEQHAQSTATIAKEKANRLPELLEAFGAPDFEVELEAQLEALRVELRALDELRRGDEADLRDCEREASARLATAGGSKRLQEQVLRQQLEEEKQISATLQQVITMQEAIIRDLSGD